ncbi:hypothetical protein FRB90_012712 [Tulasnella sp. 427]|nr:hypothetical protein FRB90_012712 [Tulasnella sp. 427]
MFSKSLVFTTLVATLFAASNVHALEALNPKNPVQCKDITLEWNGEKGPFNVYVFTGCSDDSDDPIATFTGVTGNSVTWPPTLYSGDTFFFQVEDSTGNDAFSDDAYLGGDADKISECKKEVAAAKAASASSDAPSSTDSASDNTPTTMSRASSTTTPGPSGVANAASDPTSGTNAKAASDKVTNGASTLLARPVELALGVLAAGVTKQLSPAICRREEIAMSTGQEKDDDLLTSSLNIAFTQPPSLPTSVDDFGSSSIPPPIPAPTQPSALADPPTAEAAGSGDDNSWKEEYDARVAEWRAQSAVARKKAEETRERYAAIRAQEEAENAAAGRQPLPAPNQATLGEPGREHVSPADVRDLVSGEHQGHPHHPTTISSPAISVSHPSEAEQDRWEDVPSVVSSFPSLPSGTSPPSRPQDTPARTEEEDPLSSKEKDQGKASTKGPAASQPTLTASQIARPQPPSVTPLVLDSSLPAKTRAFALISSLAINMFLPFVNGVMLGFGEIFARNVLAPWIGWQSVINPRGTRTLKPKPMSPAEQKQASSRADLRSRQAQW